MLKIAALTGWFIMTPTHGPFVELGGYSTQALCQQTIVQMPLVYILLNHNKNDFACEFGQISRLNK